MEGRNKDVCVVFLLLFGIAISYLKKNVIRNPKARRTK
jgi:hypothetical protein